MVATGPENEVFEDESGRTIKSKKEFVDAFGNLHVKTEVRRTDESGNEVSRETHYSVRSMPPQQPWKGGDEDPPRNRLSNDDNDDGNTYQEEKYQQEKRELDDKRRREKSGWFWR